MRLFNKFKNSKLITRIIICIIMVFIFGFILTGIFLGGKYLINMIHKNQASSNDWLKRHVNIYKSDKVGSYLVDKPSYVSIYGDYYQDIIDELINDLDKSDYSIDSPLFIYNPYGTNNNSINVYFKTDKEYKVSYTISVNGYNDFSRTLYNGTDNEFITDHEYQMIGFIMGEVNKLKLTLTDSDGNSEDYNYKFDFRGYKLDTSNKLNTTIKSDDEVTDGLFAILGDSRDDEDYFWLVDNEGTVRSEIPILGYRSLRLLFDNHKMYFSISERKIASINRLGKVERIYKTGKYLLHHDYAFDDSHENLLVLASDTTEESCEDAIIKINLETGKITDSFMLEEVFPDVLDKAYYNEDEIPPQVESKGVDWMHINTINYLSGDTVILSSREMSSIIKVSNIFDDPKVEYVLGDENVWEKYDEKKYLYEKIGDFTISGGQHTVTYEESDTDGVYYLTMFDNNLGTSLTMPKFDWKSIGLTYSSPKDKGKSYYYKYKVDENNKTFELVDSFEVPYSAYMSSSQEYDGNIIIDSAQACVFSERNSDGKIIRNYKFDCESSIYRVFKYNFNGYYFS